MFLDLDKVMTIENDRHKSQTMRGKSMMTMSIMSWCLTQTQTPVSMIQTVEEDGLFQFHHLRVYFVNLAPVALLVNGNYQIPLQTINSTLQ